MTMPVLMADMQVMTANDRQAIRSKVPKVRVILFNQNIHADKKQEVLIQGRELNDAPSPIFAQFELSPRTQRKFCSRDLSVMPSPVVGDEFIGLNHLSQVHAVKP